MTIKAVSFRILVQPDEVETTTAGGLVLAVDEKMEKNAQTSGIIVDIGEDAFVAYRPKTQYCGLSVGDRVHYPKYAGKWIRDTVTKEEFLAINDEDIIAVEKAKKDDHNELAS